MAEPAKLNNVVLLDGRDNFHCTFAKWGDHWTVSFYPNSETYYQFAVAGAIVQKFADEVNDEPLAVQWQKSREYY